MKKVLAVLVVILLVFTACSSTNVKRVDPDKQIDLSGYWNDVDVKIVCDALSIDLDRHCTISSVFEKESYASLH